MAKKQNSLNLTEELFDSAIIYAMHIYPQISRSTYSSTFSSYDKDEDSVVLRSIANILITILAVEDIEDFHKAIKQENINNISHEINENISNLKVLLERLAYILDRKYKNTK